MVRARTTFNHKRRIADAPNEGEGILKKRPRYVGVSYHKRNPGDFDLTPPSDPRPSKTLCDEVEIFTLGEARSLLCKGFKYGLISKTRINGWPKNIWAVSKTGIPLEAMLDQSVQGTYHGYPMGANDPLRHEVLNIWKKNEK